MGRRNLRYPHLLPPDVPVWEAFLAKHGQEYDTIDYDVRVGQGRPYGQAFGPQIAKMALDISMRRIDAVATATDRIDLIEVTRLADLKAIGQLFSYPVLYAKTYHPTRPIRPVLVAARLHTDIQTVIDTHQIQYFLFPEVP
jgi:hypothetical protein